MAVAALDAPFLSISSKASVAAFLSAKPQQPAKEIEMKQRENCIRTLLVAFINCTLIIALLYLYHHISSNVQFDTDLHMNSKRL